MLDQRGRLLIAALGFAGLRRTPSHPALHALDRWLDTWRGIGDIAIGLAYSLTSATGTAWEPTPWRAVQGAAWEAFTHMEATR